MDEMKRMDEMSRSEAIRRAVGRIPTPQLAEGFTARTMERLHRAEQRRQRLERLLMVGYGLLGVGTITVLIGWIYTQLAGQSPIQGLAAWWERMTSEWTLPTSEWKKPDLSLPQVELPAPTPETAALWQIIGLLAVAGLMLLIADQLIRRRIAASQRK